MDSSKKLELAAVAFLALIILSLNYNALKDFKQLPSPIYGGDLWSHMGSIYHIYYGGSIFDSSQLIGETPWVPWLYYIPVLLLAWILHTDPLFGVIWLNLPLILCSIALMYLVIKKYTKDLFLILIACLFIIINYPIFKYTDFAFYVMMPALVLAWLNYLSKNTTKNKLLLIAVISLANLANTQLFFAQYILFALVVLNELYSLYKNNKTKISEIIPAIRPYIEIGFVGFVISLLYWYWPIFVYHGSTPNDLQIYGWADYSQFNIQISYPIDVLKGWYPFNVELYQLLLTILKLGGALLIIKYRNKDSTHKFAFLLLLSALVGLFHHLITFNLAHIHFAPERIYGMLQTVLIPIQIALAIEWLKERKQLSNVKNYLAVPVLFIFAFIYFNSITTLGENVYYKAAKSDLNPQSVELKNWILSNTNVYDVFLTTNEGSFALNAYTGRKVITYRRTHTSTYADMNQRMLDSAAILYGDNDQLRKDLIKKYNLKYLYWSVDWLSNEFMLSQDGHITSLFDPLMVPDKPEYRKFLDQNGIEYLATTYYLDPAWQPSYPTYQVLVVVPKVKSFDHPWSYDLDKYLTEIKDINVAQNDQIYKYGIIYGVKND